MTLSVSREKLGPRKRGMKAGSALFIIGIVVTVIYASVYRSNTGHLPSDLSYWVVGTIALSIAIDIDSGFHEAIDESSKEIKAELKELKEEANKANERLEAIESKLDELRAYVEESIEESKMKGS